MAEKILSSKINSKKFSSKLDFLIALFNESLLQPSNATILKRFSMIICLFL